MARPKGADKSIENLLKNKISSIENQIVILQKELEQTKHILADYETNRTTIETILGLQNAPDLAAPKRRTTKK